METWWLFAAVLLKGAVQIICTYLLDMNPHSVFFVKNPVVFNLLKGTHVAIFTFLAVKYSVLCM